MATDIPKEKCSRPVSDRTGFHWWLCNKDAKVFVVLKDGRRFHACGIHPNQAKRRADFDHSEAL